MDEEQSKVGEQGCKQRRYVLEPMLLDESWWSRK